jgi:Glycosyl transferase family 2
MPCLNEAGSVASCVAKAFVGVQLAGLVGEVVVVDNGSTDNSAEIARTAGARVVAQPARGYGNAYRKGFQEAKGRIVVMGDCDDSYDFTQIPELIAPIQSGADYVLGSRFRGQIQRGAMTWSHRYIGNPVLTGLLNMLFGLNSSDAHSGLRAFRREALDQMSLRCDGMEFASEIVVKAARAGLEVAEVPIVYHPRTGESKLNSLRDAWRHVRFLLLLSALRVLVGPGLLLFSAGLAGQLLVMAAAHNEAGVRSSDVAIGVMLVGMQLMVFGVITKTFSYRSGFEAESPLTRFVDHSFSLERGLMASALVAVFGAILVAVPVLGAVEGKSFGEELESFGSGIIFVAAQLAFCSFVLALLRAPLDRQDARSAIVLS